MEPKFEDIEFDVDTLLDEDLKQKEQPRKQVELLTVRASKARIVLTWLRNIMASLIIGNQTQWSVIQLGNEGPKSWGSYQLSSWLGIDGATAEWMQALDESRKSATTVRVSDRQVSQLCGSEGLGRELGKCQLVWWFDERCQLEMTPACQSEASLSCRKCHISLLGKSVSNTTPQCCGISPRC